MVEKLITGELFYRLHDDDAVSLCCVGILQFVLLGFEDRHGVPDWILRLANDRDGWDKYPWGSYVLPTLYSQLRDANVRLWPNLYATKPRRDVDQKKYSIFGFTWAFKTWILESFQLGRRIIIKVTVVIVEYMYMRTPYMDLPPTIVLPKKHGDKTKGKNSNVSPLNLGNAFADDDVGEDEVVIIAKHVTGNYFVYENVDPSKVRREDYVDCMEFLLNPYDFYLDCHMMGYMVLEYFWRQLVPHLCMPGSHSLERANQEGWLSGDVYMPINAGGNH
ncbi:hypothetical protein Tco_1077730 [Tanacetum coccineum]